LRYAFTVNGDGIINGVFDDASGALPQGSIEISFNQRTALLIALSDGLNRTPDFFNDLEPLKDIIRSQVRNSFLYSSLLPVSAIGFAWDGGFDSALKLDGAKRLAELAGLSNVTFYSADNVGHDLSIADAAQVVLAVAGAYQTAFARKQSAMVAIDAATTIEQVNAIKY
jgi:hypothetical protein